LKQTHSNKAIKVLHLVWGLGAGGIQRMLVQLHSYLDASCFKQYVCCFREKGLFYDLMSQKGASLFYVAKGRGVNPTALPRLVRLMRSIRPDIIHAHDFTGHVWGFLASNFYRYAILLRTYHDYLWTLSNLKKHINRWLSQKTTMNIMVSEQQSRHFIKLGYPPERNVIIPNGLDVTAHPPTPRTELLRGRFQLSEKTIIFSAVGRLIAHKRQDRIIVALKELTRRGCDGHLVLIGDGPQRSQLTALCRNLNLIDRVHFLGEIKVDPELLTNMDIGIFLSDGEGSPYTLMEFMAAGVPVIASDVLGVNEILSHGENGLLISNEDPSALHTAMQQLSRDQEHRSHLAANAYNYICNNHSIETMIAALQNCYRSSLKRRNSGNCHHV
jgi:glycosyltransferase involved in cell wall biosynthesis